MSKKSNKEKTLAVGGAIVGLLMGSTAFGATSALDTESGKHFQFNELSSGYQLAGNDAEKKCGEGSCGDKAEDEAGDAKDKAKDAEHKCGEGKCGDKAKDKAKDKADDAKDKAKDADKKCGEGSCG
jgi:uncharacterized low-complexity protein